MTIGEIGKVIIVGMVIIGTFISLWLGKLAEPQAVTILVGCLAYIFGNGHGILSAKRKENKCQ